MFHKGNFGWIGIFVIIIECILISGCIEQTSDKGNNESGFSIYEEEGISIKYPVSWAKFEKPGGDVLVTFMPDEEDVRRGEFNVSITENDSLDLKTFTDVYMYNLDLKFTDYHVLSENTTLLAGVDTHSAIFTFSNDEYKFKRWEIWTLRNHTFYILMYQAEISYYNKYVSTTEGMVNSFEIAQ